MPASMSLPHSRRLAGSLLLAAVLALGAAEAPAAAAHRRHARHARHRRGRFFAPTSIWNQPLPGNAPLDPSSPQLVASLDADVNSEIAGKWGPWLSYYAYSTPIYTVPKTEPRVRVRLDQRNAALQRAFSHVPLPADARPADGSDAQLTVWQPSTDRLWEFWKLSLQADGWHASWGGAMRHASRNPGYFSTHAWPGAQPRWGASGSSLPLVAGLITLHDLAQGRIDHALAIAVPHVRAGVWSWPAQRSDGDSPSPDTLPEGARLRLDPRLNLDALNLPPLTRMLARAAQTYGIVVRDTSSVVGFFGQDPMPSHSNAYTRWLGGQFTWQPLAQFPWDRLVVLQMRLSARPGFIP